MHLALVLAVAEPRVEIAHPGSGHEVHLSAPAVAVASAGHRWWPGDVVVAWHEERFPLTKTVVQMLRAGGSR